MAAQVLLLLTLMLLSNIHAEFIWGAGWSHRFLLDHTADFCSVYRWTSDGKELLFNSSGSDYKLYPLAVSHSGQYQVQCWTHGRVTLDSNSTLLICDTQKMRAHEDLFLNAGETAELTCDGVGPNQSVQWTYYKSDLAGLVSTDDGTLPGFQHQLVENKPSLLITTHRHHVGVGYFCLVKQQFRCDLHGRFIVQVQPEIILRLVGESLELNCSDGSRNQTHKWRMRNLLRSGKVSLNSTLMLPSLTLNDTGEYTCDLSASGHQIKLLYVCPESEPPAVELFTGGENLTLHCGDWNQTARVLWFMRSNRTEGRVFDVRYQRPDNVHLSGHSLVIRNVSLQDTGLVRCVVTRDRLCVFRSEFLVMFGEPELDHHLLRSMLLSAVVLMMLCVVVVVGVKVWRSRRREQLPEPVEELEMSQLSPESDVQEEAPV